MHPYLLEGEESCENDDKGVALGRRGYLNKIKLQHNCNELERFISNNITQLDGLKDYSPKETREDWKRLKHFPEKG